MAEKYLDLDHTQKELLREIASISTEKAQVTKNVLEASAALALMKFLDDADKQWSKIEIPYFGHIVVNKNDSFDDDMYIALNDNFKKAIKDIKLGKTFDIAMFFKEHYLDSAINEVDSQVEK